MKRLLPLDREAREQSIRWIMQDGIDGLRDATGLMTGGSSMAVLAARIARESAAKIEAASRRFAESAEIEQLFA